MAGLAGLEPRPRNRGLLNLRAVKSVQYVFGARRDASPMVVSPPFHSGWSGTSEMLTGRFCGSAGSFWAVTVTVGRVTAGGGVCADATTGNSRTNVQSVKRMGNIMQRETAAKVPALSHRSSLLRRGPDGETPCGK